VIYGEIEERARINRKREKSSRRVSRRSVLGQGEVDLGEFVMISPVVVVLMKRDV
jgi:hypothetical protein